VWGLMQRRQRAVSSRGSPRVVIMGTVAAVVSLAAAGNRLAGSRFSVFAPPCLFRELTGLYCPGCGSTRAFLHLVHGHPFAALRSNPLLGAVLPLLLLAVIEPHPTGAWGARLRRVRYHPATGWGLVAVVVFFGVLRNLPGPLFKWLAP
jgi:hypothetical protein